MTALYPVSLRLENKPCLVVGGGPVAARKVAGLLSAGAHVTVVAPSVVAEIEQSPSVTILRRPYEAGEAATYRFVIAATGLAEIDQRVARDADAAGVFVNCADDAEHCSAILPALHRDGVVSIAVSTDGASPALASWLRDQIASSVGTDLDALASLLAEARRTVRENGRSTETVDWRAILDGPLLELIRRGDLSEAQRILAEAVET